jgi:hypothetical protein
MSHYMLDQKSLLMKGEECAYDRDLYTSLAKDEGTRVYRAYFLAHAYVCAMIVTAIELVSIESHSEIALELAIELVKHYDKAVDAQQVRTGHSEEWEWATEEMVEFTEELEWIAENLH